MPAMTNNDSGCRFSLMTACNEYTRARRLTAGDFQFDLGPPAEMASPFVAMASESPLLEKLKDDAICK